MRKRFFALFLFCLHFLVLFFPCPVPAFASPINNKALVGLINAYRETNKLEALGRNKRLEESAKRKAREIVSEKYFGHTSPAGKPFYANIRTVGYRYLRVGEILALGCDSEKCLFDLWVNSKEHREIMLDPRFQEIGCSDWAAGSKDGYVSVCHFGRPRK